MEEFQLSKFTKEGAQLLREVTEEFNRLGIDSSNLPKTFPDDSGKIKLVFVGQYSAGKSSIIKMLTGEDVKIGAAITTQDSTPYEWNGLEIVDTPGIHTELRPDHDEITYDQINHAALLIFVITNEGFSQRMGNHFRELAIEQKRAANMVLVVNKMDRTALGNVPEQQQVIYEDLKKVTAPYDPKDLYISFVDTSSYFKALEETDERRKNRRLERSGHDEFVENLNHFAAQKGVLQKINLPLNTIVAEIKNAAQGSSAQEKSDTAAYIETIKHGKKIMLDGKRECLDDIDNIISNFKVEVARRGQETAESISFKPESEEENKNKLSNSQERVNRIAADYAQKISDRIRKFSEQSEENLTAYENTEFVRKLKDNLLLEVTAQGSSELVKGGATAVGLGGSALGMYLVQNAARFAQTAVTPLGEAAGSAAGAAAAAAASSNGVGGLFSGIIGKGTSELVKSLPMFRADPTMIQKILGSRMTGVGLAGIGAVIGLYMLYQQNKKAEEYERQVKQKRSEIMLNFRDLADDIGRELSNNVRKFMTENVDTVISNFDEEIKAVESVTANEKVKNEKLSQLLKRTENLIGEIQACK